MSPRTKEQVKVSDELQDVFNQMHDLLRKEFGTDFSFIVCAKGQAVAACTHKEGWHTPDQLRKVTARNGYNIQD